MKNFYTIIFALLLLLISCNNGRVSNNSTKINEVKSESNDTILLTDLTKKWNDCIVQKDLKILAELYSEQVSIYGVSISKTQGIENKEKFLNKYPDFNQSITGKIVVNKIKDNQYKVIFPKRTNYNKKTIDVESYLIFEKISNSWKIVNESDNTTDKNITNKIESSEQLELTNCAEIVTQILTTSPRYKELTKGLYDAVVRNGGTSFGITLEGSPNPKDDNAWAYSETYDFSLHETYDDRMPVLARFTFNPTKRQLFEYDVVNNNLKIIQFDRNLLLNFNELCK